MRGRIAVWLSSQSLAICGAEMVGFLIDMLLSTLMGAGRSIRQASIAVGTATTDPRAAKLRLAAVGCLVVTAVLGVAAAVIWSPHQQNIWADIFGWSAVAFFEAFLIVANRCYKCQQWET
jgi:hypothetical protein